MLTCRRFYRPCETALYATTTVEIKAWPVNADGFESLCLEVKPGKLAACI